MFLILSWQFIPSLGYVFEYFLQSHGAILGSLHYPHVERTEDSRLSENLLSKVPVFGNALGNGHAKAAQHDGNESILIHQLLSALELGQLTLQC